MAKWVNADKIIAFCDEWAKNYDHKANKERTFLHGIWTVREFVESLPMEEPRTPGGALVPARDERLRRNGQR